MLLTFKDHFIGHFIAMLVFVVVVFDVLVVAVTQIVLTLWAESRESKKCLQSMAWKSFASSSSHHIQFNYAGLNITT